MTWTAQLTYTARGLTADDIASVTETLGDIIGDGGVVYRADTGYLQLTLEVPNDTLIEASYIALRAAARATGLLKPTRLNILPTTEYIAEIAHPPQQDLDLINLTEIAGILGVSRQRAGQIADTDPDFPEPAVPGTRRLYTRPSIEMFHRHWQATRTRGGPRPRRKNPQPAVTSAHPQPE